jgi:HSP20 family molecular chaperone IbpA
MLGFDELGRMFDRAARMSGEGYPPYNIERRKAAADEAESILITLAVAGFDRSDIEITLAGRQLAIHGRQADEGEREYLHRGIAARQFQRCFVLADGVEIAEARLDDGLLRIRLVRHEPDREVRKIDIVAG